MSKNITITGPRSIGKTMISKLIAKELGKTIISSDSIGNKLTKKQGGLDRAIKSGSMKELIKKNGYSLILEEYKNNNFVFDLSVGSFTSTDFKKASRQLRSIAKKESTIIGLLPCKNINKAIDILYKREVKRDHFKDSDKKELLKKTKGRYSKQRDIILKNCHKIIYTENKTPQEIVEEILNKI